MQEKSWFRLTVTALAVAGALMLYMSLHPRHRPKADEGTYPKVPTDAPATSR